MNVKTVAVCLVVFGAFVSVPLLRAQDMVKVAPKNCKVLLDNDKVRMVRVTLKAGEKLEMHSHPANVVYSLNSAKAKYTYADGKTEERELKAGKAVWSDGVKHATENTGTTESRALVIEFKKEVSGEPIAAPPRRSSMTGEI